MLADPDKFIYSSKHSGLVSVNLSDPQEQEKKVWLPIVCISRLPRDFSLDQGFS